MPNTTDSELLAADQNPPYLEIIVDTGNETATIVRARTVGPDDEWYTKEQIANLERASKSQWDNIPDENRAALCVLIRDAINRLAEDLDVWVPTSLMPATNSRLDVFVSIHLAEVDEEVLRRRLETEKMVAADTAGLVELERELRPVDTDDDDDAASDG